MIDIFKSGTSGARWDIETAKRFRPFARRKFLDPHGFKVYSQNDEDGIISEIFARIGTTDKRFVEFGVENGLECNTHYLLLKGWSGLWLEASVEYCSQIKNKFRPAINTGQLKLFNVFVTRDNINSILVEQGFTGNIDLLSIDVDGNDYHIWKAIKAVNPRVVIIEYNAKFPPECCWYMSYNEYHTWDGSDRQGASLKALELLGRLKNYQLVGTNLNGVNAFFIKSELAQNKFPLPATAEKLYNPMRLNYLTYRSGHPSNVYLGSHTEGIAGEFEYLSKEQTFLPAFGFWPPEYNPDETFLVQWMKKNKAELFVKVQSGTEEILLSYKLLAPCKMRVCVEEEILEMNAPDGIGNITIKVSSTKQERIVKLTIAVDRLTTPQSVLANGDYRKVGIGIISVNCLTECMKSILSQRQELHQ